TKHRVSAFAGTDLDLILRANSIETLILTGIMTGGVVLSTLRHAADADYRPLVVGDCCSDRDEETHRVLLQKVFPWQAIIITAAELEQAIGARRKPRHRPSHEQAAVFSLAQVESAKESASETYYGGEEVESAGGMTFTFRIACLNMDSKTIAMCHEYLSCTSLVQADRTLAVRRHRIAPHEGDSTEKSPCNFSGTREHIL